MQEEIDPPQPIAQYVLVSQSLWVIHVQLDEASQRERGVDLLRSNRYYEKKDRLLTVYDGDSAIWSKERYPPLHSQ